MSRTAVLAHDCGNPIATTNRFRVGMAQTVEDLIECQRLRYLVFNCELGEGLDTSRATGLDRDQFDFICDHLMVNDAATGKLVGTYRMQSGYRAKGNLGYYGEGLFDFGPFERIRGEVLELGRACVHQEYRNTAALHMLWKGIAKYAMSCGARYLIGAVQSRRRMRAREWRCMNRSKKSTSWNCRCERSRIRGAVARETACGQFHHSPRDSSGRTSIFPRDCAGRLRLTEISRPSTSSH